MRARPRSAGAGKWSCIVNNLTRDCLRVLENLVAVELRRRGEQARYFKGRGECDFVVTRNRRPAEAIQVCWELNRRNEKRELAGLAEAARSLAIERLTVLTFDQRDAAETAGVEVAVRPVWEWLTESEPERSAGGEKES